MARILILRKFLLKNRAEHLFGFFKQSTTVQNAVQKTDDAVQCIANFLDVSVF